MTSNVKLNKTSKATLKSCGTRPEDRDHLTELAEVRRRMACVNIFLLIRGTRIALVRTCFGRGPAITLTARSHDPSSGAASVVNRGYEEFQLPVR